MERAEGLLLEADALGSAGQPYRRGDGGDGDADQSGRLVGGLGDAGGAEAERAREARGGGGEAGDLTDDADRECEEGVAIRRGVDDRRKAAAGAEGPADLGQGALLVREVDETNAGDCGVVGAGGHGGQIFAVGLQRLDVLESGALCLRVGELEDRGGDVGGEHVPGRSNPACGRKGLPASAGGDVQDPCPRSQVASSSIVWVAGPSQSSMAGPQRCHAAAAASHWARVVLLKTAGSKVVAVIPSSWVR